MNRAPYDPGWLRHRVTFETAEATPDEAGGETVTWTPLATVWARVEPAADREEIVADHLAGIVTHHVTIRWRDDIAGGMRIACRGRLFRVLTVHDPEETRRYLVAKAVEETI
jgi:SPP1 family predicted phage head-tail adaptor